MSFKDKIKSVPKLVYIGILCVFILVISLSIPTLAKYKNRISLAAMFETIEVWDGTVASSYNSGEGTVDDPYIISNAKEFAFFYEKLQTTDYEGVYFKLSDNIVINNGLFSYDSNDRVMYTLNKTKFYIKDFSNEIYDNTERSGVKITNINKFEPVRTFKGHLDGDYYTIYGLYVTKNQEEVALFNDVSGTIKNIYFENSMIFGGSNSAVLANNIDGTNISDIYVTGNVVGTNDIRVENDSYDIDSIYIEKDLNEYLDTILLPQFNYENITKVTLKGKYNTSLENQLIHIDGNEVTPGEFSILLDSELSNGIEISIPDQNVSSISLTDLSYEVEFNYPITSSLVGTIKNSNVRNLVNKSNVYGINSSGIAGIITGTNLENGYNTGNISGSVSASGIVSVIKDSKENITINNFYNAGNIVSTNNNMFNKIVNNSVVSLNSLFNVTQVEYVVNEGNNEIVFNDVYDIYATGINDGAIVNDVNVVLVDYFKNKNNMVELGYAEFLDNVDLNSNPNNAWIYESGYYPILYFDELNDPIVSLNVGTYSWNDLGFEFKDIYFDNKTAFNVTHLSELNTAKSIQYYLHRSESGLSKTDLINHSEWIEYTDIVQLDEEGHYIVYIKIIDQYDNVSYVNSEHLIIDYSGPSIALKLNEYEWNSFREEFSSYNIYEVSNLTVEVNDLYSEVSNVSYYKTDKVLTLEELENIDEWEVYTDTIPIDELGGHVIYIKAIDNCGNQTIINSDKIVYGGYSTYLKLDEDKDYVDTLNVSDKSEFIYQFKYDHEISYADGYETLFITNVKLPVGTKLYMVDNVLRKAYYYDVTDDNYGYSNNGYASYYLKDFISIGNKNDVKFNEETYLKTENKDVSIFIDFMNAEINNDFVLNGYLETRDNKSNIIMSTLINTYKKVNVYDGRNGNLSITNNSLINTLSYDSNSNNVININTTFNYDVVNDQIVYDSLINNNRVGISIKLVSSQGAIIGRNYLKNMEFVIDGVNYFADSDGIVRIDFGKYNGSINKYLNILTHENDIDLPSGNYNLVITPYMAYDGKYYTELSNSSISVPVVSDYVAAPLYDFNVIMRDESRILYKADEVVNIPLTIINNSNLIDPNVRISLYKKYDFSAYNQLYEKIDLNEYSTDEFTLAEDFAYYVDSNEFILSLNVSSMIKTGYELRFELYSGDTYIYTIKKKFILR